MGGYVAGGEGGGRTPAPVCVRVGRQSGGGSVLVVMEVGAVTSSGVSGLLRSNRRRTRKGCPWFARLCNPTALCGRRRDGELHTSCGSSRQHGGRREIRSEETAWKSEGKKMKEDKRRQKARTGKRERGNKGQAMLSFPLSFRSDLPLLFFFRLFLFSACGVLSQIRSSGPQSDLLVGEQTSAKLRLAVN